MPASHLGAKHQVLLVDDDEDVRDGLGLLLLSEGFAVATASGVEDAYEQLREGFEPCVVLLDLHMPDLDGWAFIDRMGTEQRLTDVPVVIVSGRVDQHGRAIARGYDFLVKPLDGRTLVAAVECHCRRHRIEGG
jgi:DNA-binding response OmpR family regulator